MTIQRLEQVLPKTKKHRALVAFGFLSAAVLLVWLGSLGGGSGEFGSSSASSGVVAGPIRATFYYPWYPESWKQQGYDPFTNYHPSLGYYSSDDPTILASHVASMVNAGLNSAIVSWWGPGTLSDSRIGRLLTAATGTGFKLALYYEAEGTSDPSVAKIKSDLDYARKYATDDRYLKVIPPSGNVPLPVVFVYGSESCAGAQRWRDASAGWAVVLKVFSGYKTCGAQPWGWHQYAPAVRSDSQPGYSFAVSGGYWKKGEAVRLARDVPAFTSALRAMVASKAPVQLVGTWNEWGEGSAVESATEWASVSDQGAYVDAMRSVLVPALPPPPTTTATTATSGSSASSSASTTVPSSTDATSQTAPTTTIATTTPPASFTIAAAGDISCASSSCPGAAATATLITNARPDVVLSLGDNQYEVGARSAFDSFFNATWGRIITAGIPVRPAVGNHEYGTTSAQGYQDYFASKQISVGADNGFAYSFDAGGVHFVSLNSECSHISACGPENTWLGGDLAAHAGSSCTVAYWHEPRFSNGQHGNATQMSTIWTTLARNGADIVLSGHNHDYERFGELTETGAPVTGSGRGVREFVVGTGGKNHYAITSPKLPGEVVTNDNTFGVLLITFTGSSYTWRFAPVAGSSFTDSGSGSCHAAAGP